ncbi:penicillin acylase family protein [Streptomyces tubbatahanensis]|uniref:Penicillin acylase family protein n=1 Tax=Streptomyces tubbatahanensis TaxID=2923272 RepID=A0ABY3Y0J6_9ACTN|nr:penicillin acylase family protein [Streptomyces tubbatahanensis]UNT00132.1 penicillin acylase family protein [Streptomyces tubbatahanensis]
MKDEATTFAVPGLAEPVEILVDRWGVPHLYAGSRADLFLAQGFNAARERLFQLDLWRRRGLGLLSEVLGADYVEHDRAARLFLYRGDMAEEWAAYGPGTQEMARSFVTGVNAYVTLVHEDPSRFLSPEFAALDYAPAHWHHSDLARIRTHGLFYNVRQEVARALTLRDFGPEAEELRKVRDPLGHRLTVPEGLDLDVVPDDVLRVYELATTPPWSPRAQPSQRPDGSNNWVLAPSRTATGRPLLANDPHRALTLPSLRAVAHLSAPGLDVIGAGEPALPGISIGHNGHLAFGLTIFPVDQEDLYVYRTAPGDPRAYAYGDGWERMTCVTEEIPVRDAEPVRTQLWFTRHGPVVRERPERDAAFAVRAAWLGPGMAPYLGSAGYMDATTPDAFTRALRRWGAPGENQVYAATDGTVGWCPAARVPRRRGWDGTLPVPGDGTYEWDGFLDAGDLPSTRDPAAGWLATANQYNLPPGYPHGERPVTHDWYAPTRYERCAEALAARDDWSAEDCVRLQTDYVSLPARLILPRLAGLRGEEPRARTGLAVLRGWDGRLAADSGAAALFEVWYRRHLRPALLREALRPAAVSASTGPRDAARRLGAAVRRVTPADGEAMDPRVDERLLDAPETEGRLGPLLLDTLGEAVADVAALLGADPAGWAWGALHRAALVHPVAGLLARQGVRDVPDWCRLPALPRGGSAETVGAAGYLAGFAQSDGASFRMVVDVGEWDGSLAMNSPGQSGDPRSEHYADLYPAWASDGAFPLVYSRARVEEETTHRIVLSPARVTPSSHR